MPPRKKASRSPPSRLLSGTKKFQTVGDWLRFAVTAFTRAPLAFAQGLHGPQEEAMFLVARFLGLEPADLQHFTGARLTRDESTALARLIRQRIEKHTPVPYLVNEAWLAGHRFLVDERVLIPRSYIAALVPEAVTSFAGRGWKAERILDVGTGCGCLAILAAHAFPGAVVDAVDLSPDALAVAAVNVASHGLQDRVHLLQSDVFNGVPPLPYDLILANPPYEPSDLVADQPPELGHEPRLALDGGTDGLSVVRRILNDASSHLSPRGVLVLEWGGLASAVAGEFPDLAATFFDLPDGSDAVIGLRAADLASPTPRPVRQGRRSRRGAP